MLHTQTPGGAVALGLAMTADDLEQAQRLVHEMYVERGYRDPGACPRAVPPRRAVVFVGRADGDVVATLALLCDSAIGLPADALYAPQLAAVRAMGRQVAEVSALAVAPRWRSTALPLVRPLVQLVGVYARDIGHVDELCIAVHPRHAAFYERRLGFVRFGAVKPYAAVNGAPAVGLRLDLRRPPVPGALSGSLFGFAEVARIRAALQADVKRRAAAAGPFVQGFQFRATGRSLARFTDLEVC